MGDGERLVVFGRAPRLGRVKTRLTPPLTPQQALDLHRALLADTLERLDRFQRPRLEHWLYLSEPWPPEPLELPSGWSWALQEGDDLGARLEAAFRQAHRDGQTRVVIVGSDSPTLPVDYLHQAFEALDTHEAVLGPADDGGYYLVGSSRLLPELLRGVTWGSSCVLQESTEALSRASRAFCLLPSWYDVDTAEDLLRLWKELAGFSAAPDFAFPRHTAAVLSSFFEKSKNPT